MASVRNHRHVVIDRRGTCGFNCSTSTVKYAAPSTPAATEFVSIRRNRMLKCILRTMPVDLDAAVVTNTRLSSDYNVIAFAAPAIGSLATPGQFVMVKPARGTDPLLRRPFSIFEIPRDDAGEISGFSILNKRIGVGTAHLYEVERGTQLAVLGPLGRPFEPVSPPAEAWMVAGGVGLAPFLTLAEALRQQRTRATLFYG